MCVGDFFVSFRFDTEKQNKKTATSNQSCTQARIKKTNKQTSGFLSVEFIVCKSSPMLKCSSTAAHEVEGSVNLPFGGKC